MNYLVTCKKQAMFTCIQECLADVSVDLDLDLDLDLDKYHER